MTQTFRHTTSARRTSAIVTVGAVWIVLIVLYIFMDAAWWIVGVVALATLPAIIDIARNRPAGMELGPAQLTWHSGRASGDILLSQIEKIRMDTRLDLSVRVTIIPTEGRKLRLPYDAMPKSDVLEREFTERDIKVERHHFSLLG